MVTHFDATLSMGGWLDLTQQGLSPCKKYKTSWRSPAKSYRIIDLVHLLLSVIQTIRARSDVAFHPLFLLKVFVALYYFVSHNQI